MTVDRTENATQPTADRSADGRLISHTEAAAYLDVPPATLHQWNYRGVGPRSYRIGRHRKYRLADLDAFIEAHADEHGRAA